MRKVSVVTGNRCDYWLLRPLLLKLQESDSMELGLVVTGAHFKQGTIEAICSDGFNIQGKVECYPESDTNLGMVQAIGRGIIGFSEIFQNNKPDLLILLGDRFELLAAATAAYGLKIPIAHIHGGEVTRGALDDGFRHAVSKFSGLHFVSHDSYRQRLMRMGESPDSIHVVGAIGIDNLYNFSPVPKEELLTRWGFDFMSPFFLVTLHPATLDKLSTKFCVEELIYALDQFPDHKILVTQANPDPEGTLLNQLWEAYRQQQSHRVHLISNLGDDYLSVAHHSELVIGNSSSGVLEIPYLNKNAINIGKRQSGRIFPDGVHQVSFDQIAIANQIKKCLLDPASHQFSQIYGKPGYVAKAIYDVIANVSLEHFIYKGFYDGQ